MPASRVQTGATHNSARNCEDDKQADILIKLYLLVQTLMPPQARVGDASMVPADAHGCPACPHPAVGPAIQGSPNVLTNGLPSVRVGDAGIHAACCGPNKWNAKTGSRSVLINGRPAHRLGDMVKHCGGAGRSIQGSSNVIVGDNGSSCNGGASTEEQTQPELEHIAVQFVFFDNSPVSFADIDAIGDAGEFASKTDAAGHSFIRNINKGEYKVNLKNQNYIIVASHNAEGNHK